MYGCKNGLIHPFQTYFVNRRIFIFHVSSKDRNLRMAPLRVKTAFFDEDDNHQPRQRNPNLERIKQLNKLFYLDHRLTQPELEDLIVGTCKKFYRIALEVVEDERMLLVIYPEVKRKDDFEYIQELMKIAHTLSDFGLKQFIQDQFKHIQMKKEPIVIPLPVKNIST